MNKAILVVLPILVACTGAVASPNETQPAELSASPDGKATDGGSGSGDAGEVDGGGGSKDGGSADGSSDGGEPDGAVDGGMPDSGGTCWAISTKQTTCETDFKLFKQAKAECEAQKGYLNVFSAYENCRAGNSSGYMVTCCSTPPSCNEGGGMGGPTCEHDNTFFESAEQSCKGSVAEFKVGRGTCSVGSGDEASFTCACL